MNAVFFDMDGTLFDSRADLARAVNFTRQDLGLQPLPQETVVGFVGCGARHLLENSIPERAGMFDELWPRFSENDCTRDLQTLIEKYGTVYVIYSDDTETAGLGKWLRRKITFMQGELVFKSDDYGSEKYGKDNYVPVEHVERFWLYKLTK